MEFVSRLRCLLFLCVLIPALANPAFARNSRFDRDSLTLDIPCLQIMRDGAETGVRYQLQLNFNGSVFVASNVFQLLDTTECLASYDLDSGELIDQVRYGDNIFDVVMSHAGQLNFTAESVVFRESGTTSMWRVSDGINELYIGGTIHILNIDDFPLPSIFLEAFFEADILVTEISQENLEGEDNADAGDLIINPDGALSEILLPGTLLALNNHLDQLGLTIDPIDNYLPYWAGRTLIQLGLSSRGYGPGVDAFFMELASGINKPNSGLETAISQVVAVNSSQSNVTADELILSAIAAAESDDYYAVLDYYILAWREGDIEFFEEVNDAQKSADPDYYNLILRDRNLAWIPQIEEMLQTEEVEIILVGVGHLAGDDNVLWLLEELGYTVERYRQ